MIQMHYEVVIAAEACMRRECRQYWRATWWARMIVFFNLACAAAQLARIENAHWLGLLTPLSLYCAWYSFGVSEKYAADLVWLRRRLAGLREKIKTVERMTTNEN